MILLCVSALAVLQTACESVVSVPMHRLEGSLVRYVQMPKDGRVQNLVIATGYHDWQSLPGIGISMNGRDVTPEPIRSWASTKTRVDGVLDESWLTKQAARIDFANETLTLHSVPRAFRNPMPQAALTSTHRTLIARGYTAVTIGPPYARYPLAVPAGFAGTNLEVRIDTGEPSQVDLGDAWQGAFGLSLAPWQQAGPALMPYSIGSITSQAPIAVRSDSWNFNSQPDTLGIDLLDRHAAVLDLGTGTLYLKPASEPTTLHGFQLPTGGAKSPRELEDEKKRNERKTLDHAPRGETIAGIAPGNAPPPNLYVYPPRPSSQWYPTFPRDCRTYDPSINRRDSGSQRYPTFPRDCRR